MMNRAFVACGAAVALACAFSVLAQEKTDYILIHQIRQEAFDHSQVMDHIRNLTDRYGPRLTASPEFDEAAQWAMGRLKSWELSNVHTESWGPFGRSWSLRRYSVEMIQPRYSLLDAMPLAWSSPTGRPVEADLALAPFAPSQNNLKKTAEDFEKYKQEWRGKLRGKVVLFSRPRVQEAIGRRPIFDRYSDQQLADLAKTPDPVAKIDVKPDELNIPEDPEEAAHYMAGLPPDVREALSDRSRDAAEQRDKFFVEEGVAAILMEDSRSHEAMAFAEGAGTRKATDHMSVPKFRVTEEHYNRLARLVQNREAVKVRVDLEAAVGDRDLNADNIIAELPGSGGNKNQIVMIGAHFDSWHGATGATDNAAGSAVMMEVMRILSTLHVKLDRTVRLALWSGEEEGLLGSKAYVRQHFGDAKTGVTPQQADIAAYFNLDNGSGRIRGVYLQDNDAARPFFERALAPFRDLGVTTISMRNTGGTDHLSFDAVGIAGFQFIQDPLDYSTVTHHSSMDTYDHIVPADLMQASAVIASVVVQAANAPDKVPGKPLPVARQVGTR